MYVCIIFWAAWAYRFTAFRSISPHFEFVLYILTGTGAHKNVPVLLIDAPPVPHTLYPAPGTPYLT